MKGPLRVDELQALHPATNTEVGAQIAIDLAAFPIGKIVFEEQMHRAEKDRLEHGGTMPPWLDSLMPTITAAGLSVPMLCIWKNGRTTRIPFLLLFLWAATITGQEAILVPYHRVNAENVIGLKLRLPQKPRPGMLVRLYTLDRH
ncbi:hypothetical protein PTI98_010441 [Pleurotus ostreatus]|nr:hypothetical protein PTI98_010441 [Pleurotus ostreatus]